MQRKQAFLLEEMPWLQPEGMAEVQAAETGKHIPRKQRHSLEAELGAGRGMFTLAGGHSAGGQGRRGPQGLGNPARRLQLSPRVAQGHQPSHGQLSSGNKWGPTFSQEQLTCKEDEHALGQHLHSSTGSPQHPGTLGTAGKPDRHPRHLGETDKNIRRETSFSEECVCNTHERTIPLLGHSLRGHRRTQPRRQEVSCFHSEHRFVANNPGIPSLPVGFSVLDFLYLPHQEGSDQKK